MNADDQFGLNLSDILLGFEFQQQDILSEIQYGNEEERQSFDLFVALKTFAAEKLAAQQAFDIGFQTPDTVCFTRGSRYQQDIIRSKDILTVNRNIIRNQKYDHIKMSVLIH